MLGKNPLTVIKKGKRFYFDVYHRPESLLFRTLPSTFGSLVRRVFRRNTSVAMSEWHQQTVPLRQSVEPIITWVGHATFLIQVQGFNILVDPIWGSPSWVHPRIMPPGIPFASLPAIDAVLLSHNHRDHMDTHTLVALKKQNPSMKFLVPLGDKKWFDKRSINNVIECDWEDTVTLTNAFGYIQCTFVPGHHWSQRFLFDKNCSLWGGWVLQAGDFYLYFAGDTAYAQHCFERIAYLFPRLTVALLPIAPGEPREWMRHTHLNAREAGNAFLLLGAQIFVPMHWGTFGFGYESCIEPIHQLAQWQAAHADILTGKTIQILKVGEQFLPGKC